ncbi:hypothetical protein PGQ11_008973 [Apiospora arundinis]|uniref:Uncharacterized protein n=1 Tax=Apiospora arundinis TaxID=335852 RepID=A0ABR2IHI2_9PEZI
MASTPGNRRLHFTMPPGLERFPLFFKLPWDVRYKVWSELIYVPGIHFLKFEAQRILPRRANHDDDESDREEGGSPSSANPHRQRRQRPRHQTQYSAILTPIFPLPAADVSYYMEANKNLAKLTLSCQEAADMVVKAIGKPGALHLDNGRLISLASSGDVICIDYPDLNWARNLSAWANNLNQSQLDAVRCLAVKYHPDWDEERRRCHRCGHVHPSPKINRHRHLYEFPALFKNLERFYFIDYHSIRASSAIGGNTTKSKGVSRNLPSQVPRWFRPGPAMMENSDSQGRKFLSGGRTYYELDPLKWQLHSNVFGKLDWLRSEYLNYCKKHPEKAKHGNPDKVKFWVLGCEWDYEQLQHHQNAANPPTKSRSSRQKAQKKEKAKREDITKMMEKLELSEEKKKGQDDFEQPAGLPVRFGGHNNHQFQFQFPVKR